MDIGSERLMIEPDKISLIDKVLKVMGLMTRKRGCLIAQNLVQGYANFCAKWAKEDFGRNKNPEIDVKVREWGATQFNMEMDGNILWKKENITAAFQ